MVEWSDARPSSWVTYAELGTSAQDLVAAFNMSKAKPAPTPFLSGVKISRKDNAQNEKERAEMKEKPLRRLVGMLMFLARCTRPDILTAVVILARYQVDPGPLHWKWGMHILRYLAGTLDLGIVYGKCNVDRKSHVQYVPYSMYHDSDWAGCPDDAKSTTGWISFSWGGAISWHSTKQKCNAQSSCEAEYIASNEAARETVWSIRLLESMGHTKEDIHATQRSSSLSNAEYDPAEYLRKFPSEQTQSGHNPIVMFCDSTAAIANTKNPGRDHRRMKHISNRYHYVRDLVKQGVLDVCKVHTDDNVADILTKDLKREVFLRHGSSYAFWSR